MARRYTESAGKKAWQYAGPDCPNPDCENLLYGRDENGVPEHKGTIAHIHGLNEGSARYLQTQSDDDRKAFTNLIVLCRSCSLEIDGQGQAKMTAEEAEKKYPADVIKGWKDNRVSLVIEGEDMNWIRFPRGTVLSKDGYSISYKSWVDRNGQEQLFTAKQKAKIDQLQPLADSIRHLHDMLGAIEKTEGKPSDPSNQSENDGLISYLYGNSRRLPKEDGSWLGYFTESLLIAQDISLGEFLTLVTGQEPQAMRDSFERGRKMLKEKAEETDPGPFITKIPEKKPEE